MTTNAPGKYKSGKMRYKRAVNLSLDIGLMEKVRQEPVVIAVGLSCVVEAFLAKMVRDNKK